jgi:hypothetical protein
MAGEGILSKDTFHVFSESRWGHRLDIFGDRTFRPGADLGLNLEGLELEGIDTLLATTTFLGKGCSDFGSILETTRCTRVILVEFPKGFLCIL